MGSATQPRLMVSTFVPACRPVLDFSSPDLEGKKAELILVVGFIPRWFNHRVMIRLFDVNQLEI